MNYQRVVISKFGAPEVLKLIVEEGLPEPRKGEVRIRVLKASANFTDTMIRKGKYPEVRDKPPFSPGYDMIGVVDKLGPDVDGMKVGDKVADLTVIGSYSQYICLSAEKLVLVPEGVDDAEGVTLILSYMTAYQMLHRDAKVKEGQSILIHAAAGAVGIAMLQLGQLMNLKMYGTASKAKHGIVEKYGGVPIDYKSEDFVDRINELSADGLDAVFDPIGGNSFKRSFSVLKRGGKLVAFGFYNAVMGKGGNMVLEFMKLLLWNIMPNGKKTSFYIITSMRKKHPEWFKEDLQHLFQLLLKGEVKPEIEGHYTLDQAVDVHRKIENAEIKGKVVFDVA
jgi:NADPH:quinone reductase-like Zn-dependent oxidoreductase